MYSVVLMMALSGSADVPAFGHRHGGGCCGEVAACGCACAPAPVCGCACAPAACGCEGRRHRLCGGGGGLFRRHNGCCGQVACGSCAPAPACGCCGAVATACATCGPAAPLPAPPVGAKEMPKPEGIKPPKAEKEIAAPALILVTLPAEAQLAIDGAVTQSTSTSRSFASPDLQPGVDYHYTLTAEIVRDGKTVTASRRIAVRAGEETHVALEFPVASVVQK
jgi:uncharacterized protein (TIGR03000 family)